MDSYQKAAEILAGTRKAVAFTGAGISAESNIPTFRDPGGIWDMFDPEEFGTVEGMISVIQKKPEVLRGFLLHTVDIFEKSRFNPAHAALAELGAMGILRSVITQNIDNLHADAGSSEVLEVHGNLFRARCVRCGRKYPLDKFSFLKKAREIFEDAAGFGLGKIVGIMGQCQCGGMLRPDVVMFGEPVQLLHQAFQAAQESEVMLVLGTSGVVYPAAALPHQAHQSGARIIEINPTENSYSAITEVYISERSGQAMPKIMAALKKLI